MTLALGALLGAGLVLAVSPWLWPRREGADGRLRPAAARVSAVRRLLARAGLAQVPAAVLVLVSAVLGIVAAALVLAASPVPSLAIAAGVVAAILPAVALAARGRARWRAVRRTWPDLVDHLVAGVRAGRPLVEAVASLAETGSDQTRAAFETFRRRTAAGLPFGVAIDELKAELADPVADRVVETLRLAHDVGGSELPAVLRALAGSLRQEAALRAEVEARQSWVRGAARLGVAAPWVVLLLLASRPEAAAAYNSPGGVLLLACGLGASVVAYRAMLAIGRLPDERRWFA